MPVLRVPSIEKLRGSSMIQRSSVHAMPKRLTARMKAAGEIPCPPPHAPEDLGAAARPSAFA